MLVGLTEALPTTVLLLELLLPRHFEGASKILAGLAPKKQSGVLASRNATSRAETVALLRAFAPNADDFGFYDDVAALFCERALAVLPSVPKYYAMLRAGPCDPRARRRRRRR